MKASLTVTVKSFNLMVGLKWNFPLERGIGRQHPKQRTLDGNKCSHVADSGSVPVSDAGGSRRLSQVSGRDEPAIVLEVRK